MLTQAEIGAGAARLTSGKLKLDDVEALTGVFKVVFAGLESKYSYDFEGKLTELDDTGNTKKAAAQVAAAIIKMEDLGFTRASLKAGGRNSVEYSQNSEYLALVLYSFSKIYPVPSEFSSFDLTRASWLKSRASGSTQASRAWY